MEGKMTAGAFGRARNYGLDSPFKPGQAGFSIWMGEHLANLFLVTAIGILYL